MFEYHQNFETFDGYPDGRGLPEKYKNINLINGCVDPVWFIYPYNKEFSNKIIVFSDVIKTSKYWQRDIYNISIKNEKLKNLFMTFKENKIFYSSDMCGTDFKQVIDFMIRR